MNASLATSTLLKPVLQYEDARGRTLFVFPNRQHRRQIGEGHSYVERIARRERRNADYRSRRLYKRERIKENLAQSSMMRQGGGGG